MAKNNLEVKAIPKNSDSEDQSAFSIEDVFTTDKYSIIISGEINNLMAVAICSRLLNCAKENPTRPIYIYIDSPGGYLSCAFSILAMLDIVPNPIITYATGEVCSAAFILFIAGDHRFASARSMAMAHEISTSASGFSSQIASQQKGIKIADEQMLEHFCQCTGKPKAYITKHILQRATDQYISPEDMIKHGCADEIVPANTRKNKDTFAKISKRRR